MNKSLFDSVPSSKHLLLLLKLSLLLFPIVLIAVNYAFEISGYPVSYSESQLSFSGGIIKSHFAVMTQPEVQLYRVAQGVDYFFILVYGLLIFSLGVYLGRNFPEKTKFRYLGYITAISGIIAAFCDAGENLFILLMTFDTSGFPNPYAIVHSSFAACKFALLGFSIAAIVVLLIGSFLLKMLPRWNASK
jgi:hypothetical protein